MVFYAKVSKITTTREMMSKIKNPQQKKQKSLQKDRRNTYSENDKSSRKNIPKSKAISHQQERKARNQRLEKIDLNMADEMMAEIVNESIVEARIKRLRGFKKCADTPLGEVIQGRKEWQEYLAN